MEKRKDPYRAAEEAAGIFSLQAEEATRAMQAQADEADRAIRASISPFWDSPESWEPGEREGGSR